ncbi:cell division protein FtsA [Salsuginibacillus halophilus]|uniref:Cell division protein FtsA n=1 Tax=Salsuginibacillus halophilus TaxID=517424 RepID=A0A2P8HX26_9BACI|nr:cell division protein FtsA [Salsuginibacillus halophilus]PSL50767.1 cell division protein FtsA [Salsuginibacillus halophilus]
MANKEIYVSLDIGTSCIRVVVGEMANQSLNVLSVGEAASYGLKKGAIVDIDATVKGIQSAVEQAERSCGFAIERVIVGVNGHHVDLQPSHGVVAVSSENREITNEDIDRVIDAAQVVSIPPEREIVDVVPNQFVVDGLDEITDPRGMIGVRLEMDGTIITASKTLLHNLLRCVERAGLEVSDIGLQPLAAGMIAASKDERSLGVALVDIGGGATTLSVFKHGRLQNVSVLPVGGENISNDISVGFRTSTEEAEKVKREHGHAFIDDASDDVSFSIPVIGSDSEETYTQYELAHIIEPRMEEIFEMVAEEMVRLGYNDLPGGFVLTGGTVMMPGALELARDVLNIGVRVAVPDHIGVRSPQYTNTIGLIEFAHRNVKIQGKDVGAAVAPLEEEAPHRKQQQSSTEETASASEKGGNEKGLGKRMKNIFRVFFE